MPAVLAHAGGADESLAIGMVFAALWVGWIGWSKVRGTGFPRLPRAAGFGLLAAGGALLVASAVVPDAIFGPTQPPGPEVASPSPSAPRPASTATLEIVSPTDGAVVGDELEIVMELGGGRVVEEARTDLSPDEGHIHVSIDGQVVSMTYGTVQVVDLRTLDPGEHLLEAEFVAADHAPFSPRVLAKTTFTTGGDG